MAVHPAHLTELVDALDDGDVVIGSRATISRGLRMRPATVK